MKNISIYLLAFLLISHKLSFGQVTINMERKGGVSVIPCKINGLEFDFIFDTGASDVTLSFDVASQLWDHGLIKKEDIIGTSNYQVASGNIVEGIVINLKKIEIGEILIENVKASIIKGANVPLLLGQSAISRLGTIKFNLNNNTIVIQQNKRTYPSQQTSAWNTDFSSIGVLIGEQEWMINNLDVTNFKNGDPIPEARTMTEWNRAAKEGRPAWCYFENDPSTNSKGKLYNWYAVNDPRGLAPNGWRIATVSDWQNLELHLKKGYGGVPFSFIANQLLQYKFDFMSVGVRIANNYYDFASGTVSDNCWWVKSPKTKTIYNSEIMIAWNSGNVYFIDYSRIRSAGMPVKCIREGL